MARFRHGENGKNTIHETEQTEMHCQHPLNIPPILEGNTNTESTICEDNINPIEEEEEEPIIAQSPVIQLKINKDKDLDSDLKNNLDFPKKLNKKSVKENKKDNLSSTKSESKHDHKPKKLSKQVKSKFAPGTLQFISDQLKDFIFSGWIGEREFIQSLSAYRDIIEVDEWEYDLIQRLKTVMQCIPGVMEGTKFINITVPSKVSNFYCLWVLFDSIPYSGHYWMQITDISSDPDFGLKISVKTLREVHTFDGESKLERDKRLKGDFTFADWKKWLISESGSNFEAFWLTLVSSLTLSNINNALRLIVILIVTLVITAGKFLKQVFEFFLRFLRDFGLFVHYATPLAQSVIGLFEKCVGGFYLLIAMVYKDIRRPSSGPPPQAIRMPPRPPPSLTYVPAQSWRHQGEDY